VRLQDCRPSLKRAVSSFFGCSFSVDPEGMAARESARKLKLPHNTLSSHLGILFRASLVKSRKESRSIIYSVDLEGTRDLLTFLVKDCCRGKPEVCEPLIASALAECC
jgi:ArsR family transcriptional regulator, arsenate/arsenite/antimonite-responsive transcriptional repressor